MNGIVQEKAMSPQVHQPLIKVIGVGGGGSNAIDRMMHVGIAGVQFIAANTDAQALSLSEAPHKVQLGAQTTRGLGAGGDPKVGAKAAVESVDELREVLQGAEILFLALGLGGGTGTGAAPVIADIAKQAGCLTIAVATRPFSFEGPRRQEIAEEGLRALQAKSDTVIAISNDRLLEFIDEETSLDISFRVADDVLRQGIQGVSELITCTGLINLNLMHVRRVLKNAGSALMSIGQGRGEQRAVEAAQSAITSPLTEFSTIAGASVILINITGGNDLSLNEIQKAVSTVAGVASPDADIFFGAALDSNMEAQVQVMLIAVGMDGRSLGRGIHKLVSRGDVLDNRLRTSSAGGVELAYVDERRQAADLDELDVPTFLRRRRLGRIGEEKNG